MSWMILILFVLIVIIIAAAKLAHQKGDGTNDFQYQKIDVLFTPAERSFLGALKIATNGEVEVFGKVRVADVIKPGKIHERSQWQKAFNKISSKHFDFLLCSKSDLSPICAIELNDSSHNSKKRKERDSFLELACSSAGLPLVQIKAKATYKVTEIKEEISSYLPMTEDPGLLEDSNDNKQGNVLADKVCPKCSSSMAVKIAKQGKNIGKEFWACSAFPKCRYIEEKNA